MHILRSTVLVGLLLTFGLVVAGCEQLPGDVSVTPTPIPTPVQQPKPTHPVVRGEIIDTVTLLGTVDSVRRESLSFRIGGRLNRFLAGVGDTVAAGDLLAELDVGLLPNELAKAEKKLATAQLRLDAARTLHALALEEAQAQLRLAQLNLSQEQDAAEIERRQIAVDLADIKTRQLAEQHRRDVGLLQAEVDLAQLDVENLREQIEQARLYAPFSGVIRYTDHVPGDLLLAYQPLLGLADPHDLEVRSAVRNEQDLPKLHPGQTALIRFRDYPERTVTGSLIQVTTGGADADAPDSRLPIRISFSAPDLPLTIGTFADVTIDVERKQNVLIIPNSTVHSYFNRRYVLVKDGDRTEEVNVSLGISDGERTEVLEGLEEGELVFER